MNGRVDVNRSLYSLAPMLHNHSLHITSIATGTMS
jgi:hypothetical protein